MFEGVCKYKYYVFFIICYSYFDVYEIYLFILDLVDFIVVLGIVRFWGENEG